MLRTELSNYGEIWTGWPKEEGLGIPGPANWREFRAGGHVPFGMLLKCIAEVRFGGVKEDISFEDIGLEELHRGMHDPVQAHRDYQERRAELLDFLRRVAFHPSLGCVPVGCTSDPMVPAELHQMFYAPIETYTFDDSTEMAKQEISQEGPIKTEQTAATSAGGPLRDPSAEGTIGPQPMRMVPEDAEKTKKRWDGFRCCSGNNWLAGEEKTAVFDSGGGIATGQRQGAIPDGPYRGAMRAFGDQYLPPDQQRAEPVPSSMALMRRIRVERDAEEVAEATQMQDDSVGAATRMETDPTSSMNHEEEVRHWRRESHPLHEKYKHLSARASYPDKLPDDEYPGEHITPDANNTHIPGINAVQPGRLFKATPKSRAYYTPPGSNDGNDARIDFHWHWADEAFGTGIEYLIKDVRCGIVWDEETRTHALMLAVCFRSRQPDWAQLKMWTNVARMELQRNKYGRPGETAYFADFRNESEYQGGKFPEAQIYTQR